MPGESLLLFQLRNERKIRSAPPHPLLLRILLLVLCQRFLRSQIIIIIMKVEWWWLTIRSTGGNSERMERYGWKRVQLENLGMGNARKEKLNWVEDKDIANWNFPDKSRLICFNYEFFNGSFRSTLSFISPVSVSPPKISAPPPPTDIHPHSYLSCYPPFRAAPSRERGQNENSGECWINTER